jgi:uncharacterized protein Yka (UPF0111/DUF47 family)
MFKFLNFLVSKDSIRSKQNQLNSLAQKSTREAEKIQEGITNLQTTNNHIDNTVKEVEEMKSRYDVLEQELLLRKSQNETYINMFRTEK